MGGEHSLSLTGKGGEIPACAGMTGQGGACYNPSAMRPNAASPLTARLVGHIRANRLTLLITAAGLLGATLVLARQVTYGVTIGYDGVQYIAAARSLLEGNGFTNYDGRAFILHPPLYSSTLAGASLGLFDIRNIAGPLNAAAFGLTIFVMGQWLRRKGVSHWLIAWACLAVAFAASLTRFASDVLSEAFFILFTVAVLAQTDSYMSANKKSSLVWMGTLTSLAWLTRYIGVVVPMVIAVFLALQPGVKLSGKAKRIVVYCLIAFAPMAIWLTRNALVAGSPTGVRRSADYETAEILTRIMEVIGGWLIPGPPELVYRFVAPLAAGAFLLALALAALRAVRRTRKDCGQDEWLPFALNVGFALAFIITHVSLILYRNPHGIQERHLLPIYIPLLFASVLAIDKFYKRAQAKSSLRSAGNPASGGSLLPRKAREAGAATVLVGLILLSWSACNAALTIEQIRDNNEGVDIGYSAPAYVKSELIRYVKDTPLTGGMVSNEAYAVYIHTEKPALWIGYPVGGDTLAKVASDLDDGTHIAFFYFGNYPYTASQFRAHSGFETVANFNDGILLRVNKQAQSNFSSVYAAFAAREPAARSFYDLYLDGRTLTYAKSPCAREDAAARFFLHVTPVNADDLPNDRKRHGFDNLDFSFERGGVRLDDACLVSAALPPYPITEIRTGQFADGARLWEANIPFR